MMQEEARDSLFGALEIVIGGTSGEVSVGSRGTENSGPVASVEGWAYPTLYYGTYLPYEEPAIHFSSNGFWCSNGNYYGVDCEIAGGSRLRANSEHTVVYVSGLTGFGTIQRDKSCGPSGSGGNSGTGGTVDCSTYIVEVSYDGGLTWSEIGRFTICSDT